MAIEISHFFYNLTGSAIYVSYKMEIRVPRYDLLSNKVYFVLT